MATRQANWTARGDLKQAGAAAARQEKALRRLRERRAAWRAAEAARALRRGWRREWGVRPAAVSWRSVCEPDSE